LSILVGQLCEFCRIEFTELFDIDRSTFSVCLVVELGVEGHYLGTFGVGVAVAVDTNERAQRVSESDRAFGERRERVRIE